VSPDSPSGAVNAEKRRAFTRSFSGLLKGSSDTGKSIVKELSIFSTSLIEKLSSHPVNHWKILGVFLGAAEAQAMRTSGRSFCHHKGKQLTGMSKEHGIHILSTRHGCACFKICAF
jgi:hypothetical protein